MRNSKKLLALLFAFSVLCVTYDASAQNREIGVKLSGLDNFKLVYKKKKTDDKYLRYELAYFNTKLQGTSSTTIFSSSAGFLAGIEKRKVIDDKLKFIHGFLPGIGIDMSVNKSLNVSTVNTNTNIWSQLGYILGVQYHFSDKFYLGLEAVPNISASLGFDNNNLNYGFRTNINFNTVGISAVYRFSKT